MFYTTHRKMGVGATKPSIYDIDVNTVTQVRIGHYNHTGEILVLTEINDPDRITTFLKVLLSPISKENTNYTNTDYTLHITDANGTLNFTMTDSLIRVDASRSQVATIWNYHPNAFTSFLNNS